MSHDFYIQASQPRNLLLRDAVDESLSDAIQTVFPMDTESALVVWKGTAIALSYKYDLSVMCADVLRVCQSVMGSAAGEMCVSWASSGFLAEWALAWRGGRLEVVADWTAVNGGLREVLSANRVVELEASVFLAEWRAPLRHVRRALREAGYSTEQIPEMALLEVVVEALPGGAQLYS